MLNIPESDLVIIHPYYTSYLHAADHLLESDKLQWFQIEANELGGCSATVAFDTYDGLEVYLELTQGGALLRANMNHPYAYRSEVYKIAAVLEINRHRIEEIPYHYENPLHANVLAERRRLEAERRQLEIIRRGQESLRLIDRYKREAVEEIGDLLALQKNRLIASLHVVYDDYYLKFKVGGKQAYALKKIQQFLTDVDQRNYVEYGKKLAFKHQPGAFTETSLQTLAFIRKIMPARDSHYPNELPIPAAAMDEFFALFQSLPLNEKTFQLAIQEKEPLLAITEEANHYRLTLDLPASTAIGQRHLYRYDNNTLIQTPLDDHGKAADFMKEMKRQDFMYLPKSHWADFYYYVLSDIKDYFYVDETNLEPLQTLEEDSISLYGDIDDNDFIRFHMDYLYGDGSKKSGFDPQNHSLSLNARKLESFLTTRATVKGQAAYFDPSDPAAIQFIQSGLPYLQTFCQVFISEALKQVGNKPKMNFTIGVSLKNNLLALEIESVQIPKDELAMVLDAYKRKKKFYRLKNGEQLYLESDGLQEMDNLLDSYGVSRKDLVDGQVELDLYRAFSLDQLASADGSAIEVQRSQLFQDMIQRFSKGSQQRYPLSPAYGAILRDYQKTGYQWLQTLSDYGFGGILADDMGLGKTLQVIALLSENQSEKRTSLVVCPASLILNWEEEIKKFAPHLKTATVYGDPLAREALIKNWKSYDLLITSYDYIRRDVDAYKKQKFHLIVLDEAQYIKNPKTKAAQAVKKLKGSHKLALTGTPIENSLAELWSIFDFLMPGYLYAYGHFQRTYETPIVKEKNPQIQEALKRLISPFILRRTKKEVLPELPEKVEKTLPIEFSDEENKLYLANLMQANNEIKEKPDGEPLNKIAILAMLTRLRQICIEPRLVFENIDAPSSKMQSCLELIKTLKENRKKVLLFSSFTSAFDLLQEELAKENISFYRLTGSAPKDKRQEMVQKFQSDNTDLFMISLKAGGTGLNLTAAEAVIHFDPWWNVSAQNQATDRAYRMGQKNMVQVFKLIMKNSIEEKIIQLQEKKKDLSDAFVEGNDGGISTMSTADLLELLSM